jgi:hypothetical protein
MEGIFVVLSLGRCAILIAHVFEYVVGAAHRWGANVHPYTF